MKKLVRLVLITSAVILFCLSLTIAYAVDDSFAIISEDIFIGEYEEGGYPGTANIVFGQVNPSASDYGIVISCPDGEEKVFAGLTKGETGKFGVALYGMPAGLYEVRVYSGKGASEIRSRVIEFYANDDIPEYEYEVVEGEAIITKFLNPDNKSDIFIPSEIDGYIVKTIGYGAFSSSNIGSVIVPNTIEKIEDDAFRDCWGLDLVTFAGENLIEVGDSAFRDCPMLSNITLPSSVNKVGELCFYGSDESGYGKTYSKNAGEKEYYVPKYSYEFLGEDVMPIMTVNEFKTRALNTHGTEYEENRNVADPTYGVGIEKAVENTINGGINVILSNDLNSMNRDGRKTQYEEVYDLLELYGGMMIYKDYTMRSMNEQKAQTDATLKMYINTLSKYPSFAGVHVMDEPGYGSWIDDYEGQRGDTIGKLGYLDDGIEIWNNTFDRKLFFVNLLQVYAPTWAFSNGFYNDCGLPADPDYHYYYRTYIENVKPQVLSYDYYPCRFDDGVLLNSHFEQLYLGHYYSDIYYKNYHKTNTGIPFWVMIQLSGWNGFRYEAKGTNYNEIMWQINTALSFGAKGMGYYSYYGSSVNARGVAMDCYGRPTDIYEMVKLANEQTQAFAKWTMNAELDHIYQNGVNPNCYDYSGNYVGAESMPTEILVARDESFNWRFKSSSGVNNLVSHMKYCSNNNEYREGVGAEYQELYFVCNNTIRTNGAITINFDEYVTGSYIFGGQEYLFQGRSLTVNTKAGEGFAILLDK
ncbi:MAG: leucine-rich repeat domain-containing protein [Clostridia bacterium]|nr:leucine-rich repeat domain-containing protein [Clostridia bacterium]